jgi:hypothetical protein
VHQTGEEPAMNKNQCHLATALVFLAAAPCATAQSQVADASQNVAQQPKESKRILWLIPNFRTSPTLNPYVPISAREKFKIARQDSFDQGTVALAAAFAGESQLSNSNRSFGQGVEGYAHYFGTAYASFVIGNFMTEGIFPTLLHQDPRYFRRGKGSGMSRLGYAMGQIFITHGDNGKTQVNFSELLGNSTAVAISMAYYPENRDAKDASTSLGTQLAVDMAANVLKEFWPDISRHFSKKHHDGNDN